MAAWVLWVGGGLLSALVPVAHAAPGAQVPLDEDRPWPASSISRSCPGLCDVFPSHVPEPAILLAGEALTVSVAVRALCRGIPTPTHIVFVVDTDDRMSSSDLRDMKQALIDVVNRLRLDEDPSTRVGLVLVEERAETLVQLTNDAAHLLRGLHRIDAGDDLRIDEGLREAHATLRRGRERDPRCRRGINEIVVVVAPEPPSHRCSAWAHAARKLKSDGILVITVCASRRCNSRCLSDIASSRRYVYDLGSVSKLIQVFDRIRDEILNITLRSLHVFEHLSPGMAFVPGSAIPPAEVSDDGTRLHWQANFVPKEGLTFTYRTRPLAHGKQPVAAGTNIFWRDNQNYYGEMQATPADVTVFGLARRVGLGAIPLHRVPRLSGPAVGPQR